MSGLIQIIRKNSGNRGGNTELTEKKRTNERLAKTLKEKRGKRLVGR